MEGGEEEEEGMQGWKGGEGRVREGTRKGERGMEEGKHGGDVGKWEVGFWK